jgi:hypothetical protein
MADFGFDWAKNALKAGKGKGLVEQTSYERFGLLMDPFSDQLPFLYPNSVYQFPSLIKNIELVGKHLHDKKNMLVISPEKGGKTFLLKFLENLLPTDKQDPKQGIYVDASRDWITPRIKEKTEPLLKNFQQWLVEVYDLYPELDIIFLDNSPHVIKEDLFFSILHELEIFDKEPIIIATISPCEFEFFRSNPRLKFKQFLSSFSSHYGYLMPPASESIMIDFLKTRLQVVEAKETLFTQKALRRIAYVSCGIPGLACQLASETLATAANYDHLKEITLAHVMETLEQPKFLGIKAGSQLTRGIWKLNNPRYASTPDVTFARNTVNSPRFAILQESLKFAGKARFELGEKRRAEFVMTNQGVTNSHVQSLKLGITKSTISHHLITLSEQQHVLRLFEMGRKKFYYLPEMNIGPLETALLYWSQPGLAEVVV